MKFSLTPPSLLSGAGKASIQYHAQGAAPQVQSPHDQYAPDHTSHYENLRDHGRTTVKTPHGDMHVQIKKHVLGYSIHATHPNGTIKSSAMHAPLIGSRAQAATHATALIAHHHDSNSVDAPAQQAQHAHVQSTATANRAERYAGYNAAANRVAKAASSLDEALEMAAQISFAHAQDYATPAAEAINTARAFRAIVAKAYSHNASMNGYHADPVVHNVIAHSLATLKQHGTATNSGERDDQITGLASHIHKGVGGNISTAKEVLHAVTKHHTLDNHPDKQHDVKLLGTALHRRFGGSTMGVNVGPSLFGKADSHANEFIPSAMQEQHASVSLVRVNSYHDAHAGKFGAVSHKTPNGEYEVHLSDGQKANCHPLHLNPVTPSSIQSAGLTGAPLENANAAMQHQAGISANPNLGAQKASVHLARALQSAHAGDAQGASGHISNSSMAVSEAQFNHKGELTSPNIAKSEDASSLHALALELRE